MLNKIMCIVWSFAALGSVYHCCHFPGVGWKMFWALYAAMSAYMVRYYLEQDNKS